MGRAGGGGVDVDGFAAEQSTRFEWFDAPCEPRGDGAGCLAYLGPSVAGFHVRVPLMNFDCAVPEASHYPLRGVGINQFVERELVLV